MQFIPNLLYISYARLPLERFEDEACPMAPELVIEIISPGQSFGDLNERATDYLQREFDKMKPILHAIRQSLALRDRE